MAALRSSTDRPPRISIQSSLILDQSRSMPRSHNLKFLCPETARREYQHQGKPSLRAIINVAPLLVGIWNIHSKTVAAPLKISVASHSWTTEFMIGDPINEQGPPMVEALAER